ncbi:MULTISPECIES: hypothetical protein [unclassified Pseudomonas]|uniref:hypothetical protein n=1 Tax=unclassified Pseudomonas TaxID=196821 RepID=UPI001F32D344|nr:MULTISPECIES: hypothetical protein [unclassified Pseudomonas]MCF5233742.1 hypothetical protein [Pseudomonas sp. PA-5-4H]MCF5239445.1 hypothetical protein [Pseudomonas sp. PA-5-4G]MCF5251648.1 hypothetical protein [Pseudomonas sp. PA-5-4B]MCF5257437.1 hypothetical protein [Pseudomonas sp. PA-5-4B]MCF5263125.1 hypothetical protein [Pseudomonas sp. PA-5-4A]
MFDIINTNDWHHGTFDRIDSFNPFSHFGSSEAAKERLDSKRLAENIPGKAQDKIYRCTITVSPNEVLSICTDWGSNRAQSLAVALKDCFPNVPEYKKAWENIRDCQDSKETSEKRKRQANEYGFPMLEKLLLSQGYKVIIYKNEVEHTGSYSLVIIDPNVIKIL